MKRRREKRQIQFGLLLLPFLLPPPFFARVTLLFYSAEVDVGVGLRS